MQDITDLYFMRVVAKLGAPDLFFTEFHRVHEQSRLEKSFIRSIEKNGTGRPIIAQVIGEDPVHLRRTVRDLARLPIAGKDLNLGCPAPKVYRKNVGGGLLRDPARIAEILPAMRGEYEGLFSVKMRYGFEDDRHYDAILAMLRDNGVDLVTVHARTVTQMYRGTPDYGSITRAVKALPCPVIANGDLSSAAKAKAIVDQTGACGAMSGRPAGRNPWIFRQCREYFSGAKPLEPTLGDVRSYVSELWTITDEPRLSDHQHVCRMKKLLNFVGLGVDPEGCFLRQMRLCESGTELFATCERFMCEGGRSSHPFAPDAHANLVARPNQEA